jgi:hypothetical protein
MSVDISAVAGGVPMKFFDPSDPNAKIDFGPWSEEKYKAIMAQAKAEFTAKDLQEFTEEDDGIPLETIIQELEALHRQQPPRPE